MKRLTPLHPESLGLQTEDESRSYTQERDEWENRFTPLEILLRKIAKKTFLTGFKHSENALAFRPGVTGFTLIELLAVMIIIMILAGLFVGAGSTAREAAKKRKAEAMIAALEVAISMYHADMNTYPADGNAALVTALTTDPGSTSWHGPYMEFKVKDLSGGQVIDPWGGAYNYDAAPYVEPWGNLNSFNLWSNGPNGASDYDKPPKYGDDIYNW